MSKGQITIAVDAMGGEDSPFKVVKGTEIFQKKNKFSKIIFFGEEQKIYSTIKENKINLINYEIYNTIFS